MTLKPTSPGGARGRATGFLRILLSAIILFILLQFVPAGELFARMRTVSPALWLGVFLAFLAGHALAAAKWRWMIGGAVSYPRALKAHFAGLAANIALPGVAGGDLVRAGLVMKGSGRKTALAIGSLADRLIDTAALLIIAAIGAIWLGARAGAGSAGIVIASLAMIAIGVAGVLLMKPVAGSLRAFKIGGKGGAIIGDVTDAIEDMAARRGALVGCAFLSVSVQFVFAVLNGLIAQNLGAGTSLASWAFAWPLAKLVATLPISFGGLGVREASLAGLMSPLGYPAAGVVAASLVWQTIQFAAGGVGAIAQAIDARGGRMPAEAGHG
ncbi:MAG: lysylphosphatidylglycerol synthase transmembrane domain-containing protein [Pseudomonadota bacterium]